MHNLVPRDLGIWHHSTLWAASRLLLCVLHLGFFLGALLCCSNPVELSIYDVSHPNQHCIVRGSAHYGRAMALLLQLYMHRRLAVCKMMMASGNSPFIQLLQAVGGGITGCLTRCITQPFDVLKIRFQMQVEPVANVQTSKYRGIIQAFRAIYKEEGVAGMWRGHQAGQIMSVTYGLVQFWSYEQLRVQLPKHVQFFQEWQRLNYFVCGGLAGCLGVVASQPFDLIRTRVVASDPKSAAVRMGTFVNARRIYNKYGLRGIFRGMAFTLLQIYPLVGTNFLVYKSLNELTVNIQKWITKKDDATPSTILFINGAVAGVVSKFFVYPADLIKKRIQLADFAEDRTGFGLNPQCQTVKRCITSTMQLEGLAGFYKGMGPTLIKSGLMTAVYFSIYDHFVRFFILPIQEREERHANG